MIVCEARTGIGLGCQELAEFPDGYCRAHHNRCLYLLRTYNIGLEDAEDILDRQQWACPVCGRSLEDQPWVVDHSHRQKKVRGLLCRSCNHRVVGRHEDWNLLMNAANYLKDPPAYQVLPEDWFVPKRKRRRRKK